MNIPCPYCKAVLNPKGLKPGRFQPKCPGCARPFVLVVPDDGTGTISVQKIASPAAGTGPKAGSGPVEPVPRPVSKPTAKRKLTEEERAALILEGKDPANFENPTADAAPEPKVETEFDPNATAARDPNPPAPPKPKPAPKSAPAPQKIVARAPAPDPSATGDFTAADDAAALREPDPAKTVVRAPDADPNVTGDFTAADGPAPKKVDPTVTGDFTAADGRAEHGSPGEATGEITQVREPRADEPTENEETKPAPKKAARRDPGRTVKPGEGAEEGESAEDIAPPRLGGYEVLKVLGKGGMGAVLLGRQISLDRKVAIKVMHPKIATNAGFVARFTREAYAAAQLTHHNVIQIYDIGEDGGQHFFSMEFVQGQSLMDLVKKEGKLPADVAVGYVLQAARGLRYGHRQGMVHRDIKPDNLMLNTEGVVKVADLGLVKLPGLEARNEEAEESSVPRDPNLTRAGAVMGTPAYMSPEQSTDSATVDGRADIYSLGCTLYVLITGRPPFEGKTALEIISKHQTEPIVPPEVVVKRVPKALSAILLKMMAKKPGDRYQSMDEVIAALEGFLGLERTGPFNPKEEQADQLEKCAHQYHFRSKSGLKRSLAFGFFAACVLGVVGAAVAGMPALAGGLLGLAVMTPVAYFVVHGALTGSVVFTKVRAVVFGMRFFDWLMWAGGAVLLLVTLFLFGFLWAWIGFAVVAAGLAFALWFLADRSAAKAQEAPLDEARGLLKSLRLQGLEEDAVRQFVCKFSGPYWEPFYETVFGYEAMLAARASRKGDTGETWKKFGTWREPIVQWADARMEARRLAKERAHLQKVEAKALVAEGVSKAEAKERAEEMAAQMVDQAAEAKQARKEGKEVCVKELVEAARERRRPKPGTTIAGKKHRSLWLKDFVNNWFGRRLRFVLGAVLFAAGLLWLHQNNLLRDNKAFSALTEGNLGAAQQAAEKTGKAATKPLTLPGDVVPVPDDLRPVLNTWALPLTGLLVLLNGVFYFGWRPTVVTVPGAAVALLGPMLGIPAVDPLTAQHLSLIIGAVLIIVVARFLRQ
ncbi:MAG: protein kinase [Planctomycetes bacterium]|nr:protein kinase [Planctomycetota bacterium]